MGRGGKAPLSGELQVRVDGSVNAEGMPKGGKAEKGLYTYDIEVEGACPYDTDWLMSRNLRVGEHSTEFVSGRTAEVNHVLEDKGGRKASEAHVEVYNPDLKCVSSSDGLTKTIPGVLPHLTMIGTKRESLLLLISPAFGISWFAPRMLGLTWTRHTAVSGPWPKMFAILDAKFRLLLSPHPMYPYAPPEVPWPVDISPGAQRAANAVRVVKNAKGKSRPGYVPWVSPPGSFRGGAYSADDAAYEIAKHTFESFLGWGEGLSPMSGTEGKGV